MSSNPMPHTRALLTYLFTTYAPAKARSTARTSSAGSAATSPLLLSVANLALEGESSSTVSNGTASEDEGDAEGSTAESTDGSDVTSDEDRIESVLSLLEDETIDEEDKPEALKDLLSSLLTSNDAEPIHFDSLILSLLHRHREDHHPSSTPVPPLPSNGSTTPGRERPTVSRSSSFRRAFPPNTPLSMTSVRPSPNGGFSSASSSSLSAPNSPSLRSAHHTPSHSPWSSPRPTPLSLAALSASAVEFKFSGSASEFRPSPSSNHGSVSGHNTPIRSRSPVNAHQAQATWAFTSSPLGTPKYGGGLSGGGSLSAASSPGYFARHLEPGVLGSLGGKERIPRLPWADATDSSGESNAEDVVEEHDWAEGPSYPRVDSPQAKQGMGGGWDPFEMNEEGDSAYYTGENGHEGEYEEGQEGLEGATGLGGMGAYSMTPFDVLCSVFTGSNVSAAILEEALAMTGWDVDAAIEYIIETQPQPGRPPPSFPNSAPSSPPQMPRMVSASGSRPLVVSRDSFDGYVGGNGGRGSPMGGQRWASGASTPTGGSADAGRGVGGRVCRYWLEGRCLRSDCKFSHDLGKALCKFWAKGHCLKGDGRCDFLHSIPPTMRADYEERTRRSAGSNYVEEAGVDEGPDLDFPTLGQAPRVRRPRDQQQVTRNVTLDPTRTRFSGAVKFGRPVPVLLSPLPPPPPQMQSRDSQPRYSARINLRPPALLPTLPTGAALAALYVRYRSSFLELGANRNKCLARASQAWRAGDGAAARRWSREAQDWNRQVAIEGRDSANRIVEERKKLIKEALGRNEGRMGSTDDAPDRRARGREQGGGVVLGVVAQQVLPRGERILTPDERTEVALDLHGLHPDEAVSFMGDFLQSLERDRFPGLAYVVIGQAKHTGASDHDRGAAAGRMRLEEACTGFLADQGWAYGSFGGILAIDALR